jgi:cell wall-associated NlpC family hydrolase
MSFSDAIGQVDQIVQWEQQLSNPAAATQSSGTAAAGTISDTSTSGASTGASFSNALAQAQTQEGSSTASVLDPTANASGSTSASDLLGGGDSQLLSGLQSATSGSGSSSSVLSALESALQSSGNTGASSVAGASSASQATSVSDPRVQSMIQEADSLVGKPYVWGGGHNNFGPQSGYDCSGFVSAVLHAGGYLTSPQDTETLPTAAGIESGPGQYVTLYDRTTPGQEGHVIMEINGQFYESGGQQGTWGGGGGVQKISTPSAAYLSTFNLILHPAGL